MNKKIEVNIDEKYKLYLSELKSENTKIALIRLLTKLEEYLKKSKLEKIQDMKDFNVDSFLKMLLKGKSNTTISNTISRIKHLFKYYNCEEVVKHLNLNYVKSITEVKEEKLLSPNEVYELIESLLNYQDKLLVMLCYLGFYDQDFNTIRKLRRDSFVEGNILILEDGARYKLNSYCAEIVEKAIKEDEMEKYVFQEGRASKPYKLNLDTPYILTSRKSDVVNFDIIPSVTLKKRFETFAKYAGIDNLSAVMIKNSKFVYDLVKLEYENNYGININQIELKNYCKELGMVGQVEKMNMTKKEMKLKIINEIVSGKTYFID